MRNFGLELHPEKTRLIEFGRYAAERRKKRKERKPETFNFLGFTHICGTTYKTGKFTVHRKTIGKRMAARLKELRVKLRQRMHTSPKETGKWLAQVVGGYFQYHAIPGNWDRLKAYRNDVLRMWFQTLRRRSQRSRYNDDLHARSFPTKMSRTSITLVWVGPVISKSPSGSKKWYESLLAK